MRKLSNHLGVWSSELQPVSQAHGNISPPLYWSYLWETTCESIMHLKRSDTNFKQWECDYVYIRCKMTGETTFGFCKKTCQKRYFCKVFDHADVVTSARQHLELQLEWFKARRNINDLIAAALPLFSSMKLTWYPTHVAAPSRLHKPVLTPQLLLEVLYAGIIYSPHPLWNVFRLSSLGLIVGPQRSTNYMAECYFQQ